MAVVALASTVAAVGTGIVKLGPAGTNTSLHQHPNITLVLNGNAYLIPANIGIEPALWNDHTMDAYGEMSTMSPLHTHDSSGTVHLEMGRWHPCTLADFFKVWGQPFNQGALLDYRGSVTMTVDGQPSEAFGNLLLQDGQQIVIRGG